MGKVIFEFDEEMDRDDIEIIRNRDDMLYALEKVANYRRKLYKGCINNELIVKDRKILAEGIETLKGDIDFKDTKSYVPREDVIEELDECLRRITHLLN